MAGLQEFATADRADRVSGLEITLDYITELQRRGYPTIHYTARGRGPRPRSYRFLITYDAAFLQRSQSLHLRCFMRIVMTQG